MNGLIQAQKPWLGEIEWEPIGNLPQLVVTIDNAIKETLEQQKVTAEAMAHANLFVDLPIDLMMDVSKDQFDIAAVYLRQIEHWRQGSEGFEYHFELRQFEQKCIEVRALLTDSIAGLGKLQKLVKEFKKSKKR